MPAKNSDPREINALMNKFRKEPEVKEIGSPYRINVYCCARLKGKSPKQALEMARKLK